MFQTVGFELISQEQVVCDYHLPRQSSKMFTESFCCVKAVAVKRDLGSSATSAPSQPPAGVTVHMPVGEPVFIEHLRPSQARVEQLLELLEVLRPAPAESSYAIAADAAWLTEGEPLDGQEFTAVLIPKATSQPCRG